MKNKIIQTFIAAFLAYCSFFLTACPKDTAVHKAARASYELSGLTRDVIAGTARAYDEHVISLETKNSIASKLATIARGGAKFNQIATAANSINANVVATDKLNLLNQILSEEIAGPFLEILQDLKALTPSQAVYLHVALAALRTAILTVSGAIAQRLDTIDTLMITRLREVAV